MELVAEEAVEWTEAKEEADEEDKQQEPPLSPSSHHNRNSMPAKLPSSKEPFKQPGQCAVSWDALKPAIGYCTVQDPEMFRRSAILTRIGLSIRVDVRAGVVVESFKPEVSHDGTHIVFSCFLDVSARSPIQTLALRFDIKG